MSFRIHFLDSVISFELCDYRNKPITDLEKAKKEAALRFPSQAWEINNGEIGYMNARWRELADND